MAFGSRRKFKTKKQAYKYVKKAQSKGYFISTPIKINKYWLVSILTKKGKNPFYIKDL